MSGSLGEGQATGVNRRKVNRAVSTNLVSPKTTK